MKEAKGVLSLSFVLLRETDPDIDEKTETSHEDVADHIQLEDFKISTEQSVEENHFEKSDENQNLESISQDNSIKINEIDSNAQSKTGCFVKTLEVNLEREGQEELQDKQEHEKEHEREMKPLDHLECDVDNESNITVFKGEETECFSINDAKQDSKKVKDECNENKVQTPLLPSQAEILDNLEENQEISNVSEFAECEQDLSSCPTGKVSKETKISESEKKPIELLKSNRMEYMDEDHFVFEGDTASSMGDVADKKQLSPKKSTMQENKVVSKQEIDTKSEKDAESIEKSEKSLEEQKRHSTEISEELAMTHIAESDKKEVKPRELHSESKGNQVKNKNGENTLKDTKSLAHTLSEE